MIDEISYERSAYESVDDRIHIKNQRKAELGE